MIQMQSVLQVADNSGARRVTCILPLGGGVGRIARLASRSWPGATSGSGDGFSASFPKPDACSSRAST